MQTECMSKGYFKNKDYESFINDVFNTDGIGATFPIPDGHKIYVRPKRGRRKKEEMNIQHQVNPNIVSVYDYKIKIDEFFNIIYDYLTGFDLDYILNKYPHRPSTLLVVNHRNWVHIFQQEFGNELSNYLLNNKNKFRSLTMGVYETKYLHCKLDDVKDRYILNKDQFEACLNNKSHRICYAIATGFWYFRLNNT